MVLPEPVRPITAIGAAGRDREVEIAQHGPVGVVAERDALEAQLAAARRAARAGCGGSVMSGCSSSTWKMRSPEATARWYWPIHMPIMRSGQISSAR